jgi:murein DD-endopeptidase MepM/ murein hydrolase activator NlpD
MATYTVKSGDTVDDIAQKYGLDRNQFLSINPFFEKQISEGKRDINQIELGETFIVPGTSQQPTQTAMDLKPADIVEETKIDRQPIPRQRPIVRNTVQQDLDTLELTDDSIKSALQQNLETIADSPGLTGLVDVGKEMLLDAASEILPSVYSDEAKAQEPEVKKSIGDALGEATKNLVMPQENEAEPNMDVAEEAIEIADKEGSPVVEQTVTETVSKTPDTEEQPLTQVSTTDIKKLADEGQISNETKEAFNGVLEGGFEFFGNSAVIKKIDKEIEANRIKLQEISSGKIKPYFGKEDTGKKIMAAIAAGLGAYASAMTGTPNSALQIINDAIDRDLAVQKDNLERQRLSIIDQNDYLQQQKADLLAYAGLELDRMSTIASTRNDALKDALDIRLKEQNSVINTGKIEAQDRKTNEYQFARSVTLADGLSGEFKEDFSVDQIKDKKRQINQFVEGYDVLVGAPDLAGRLAASLRTPLYSESFKEKIWDTNTKQYKDVSKPAKESAKVIDGVVVTDDMVSGAGSIDLTKRGVIEQLKDLATNNKIEIVAGKKLTKAGLKLVQLDTFLRNYYQRYIMITGANLTGTEVLQVNDILPRPGRYTIASGRYLEGLESTRNMLDTLYANRVLRYVKPSPDQRKQPSPKSKLNKEEYKLVGETD